MIGKIDYNRSICHFYATMFSSSSEIITNLFITFCVYILLHKEERRVDPRATGGKRMRLLLLMMTFSLSLAVNMNKGGVRNNDNKK